MPLSQDSFRTMPPKGTKRPVEDNRYKVPPAELGCNPDRVFICKKRKQVWPCMDCHASCRPQDSIPPMYKNTESGGIKHYGGIKDADGNVLEEGCPCRNECKRGRGQGRHALQQKAVQNKQKILAAAERKLQEFEIKILETRAALTQEVANATAALLEVLKDPTSHHAWRCANKHWTSLTQMPIGRYWVGCHCLQTCLAGGARCF